MNQKKNATRSEILERNPVLARHFFTRFMAGPILMGAQLSADEWRRIRMLFFAGPLLLLVFVFNLFYTDSMSIGKLVAHIFVIVFVSLAIPLISAGAYGYLYRQHIDTTGGMKGDFSNLGRYMVLYALIGFSISSGLGIFAWLK